MKNIVVSMNITLDGYMSGPDCELNWHFESWTEDMGRRLAAELGKADTVLLGRTTYQAMASYWPAKGIDLLAAREDLAFAVMMNSHRKIVYSNTLKKTAWNNSIIINGDLENAVLRLKQEQGKHIIIYGSGQLIASMLAAGLIDEFQLWIHPVMLGKGKALFRTALKTCTLHLLQSEVFSSGVVLLHYRVSYLASTAEASSLAERFPTVPFS
ncbi:MAG TPA: dihydrofolate reductase family protein [Flavisolibacter sp.]|nr:dihydrofolate reductase family protein [Flavisolibacter sp.]